MLALAGCARLHPATGPRDVLQFYGDPQGMFLVPVSRRAPLPDPQTAPTQALQGDLDLLLARSPRGLVSPFPPGSRAQVLAVQGGDARVALTVPAAEGSGGEGLMTGALVRTATAMPGVRRVSLTLRDPAGKPLESEHMDLSEPLGPSDPGMQNAYLPEGQEGVMVPVYYQVASSSYLVSVRLPIPPASAASPLAAQVALLAAGPPDGLRQVISPVLPAGAYPAFAGLRGDVAHVTWHGPANPTALRALTLTLTEQPGVHAVVVDGLPRGTSTASLLLPRPGQINPLGNRS